MIEEVFIGSYGHMFILREIKHPVIVRKKPKALAKKGECGAMVHFCVHVQEVHNIVYLCCAFRLR
jgi:hypothetical protein